MINKTYPKIEFIHQIQYISKKDSMIDKLNNYKMLTLSSCVYTHRTTTCVDPDGHTRRLHEG